LELLAQRQIQVAPATVFALDQVDLPVPLPLLDLLLAVKRRLGRIVRLEPDELVDAVFFGKAGDDLVLVFPNSPQEIGVVPTYRVPYGPLASK